MSKRREEVRGFILNEVESHTTDIVKLVAKKFALSRQGAYLYVKREVDAGKLLKIGSTNQSRYFLIGGSHLEFSIKNAPDLADDFVWKKYVKPMLANCPENIVRACAYGYTEMFNNAIDHSEGTRIYTEIRIQNGMVDILIMDNGIGIFKKIKKALTLESEREAILHLSKGKFTTDPTKHSGEGIFFTSRIFNNFSISSGGQYYTFFKRDWMLSPEKEDIGRGTRISMSFPLDSKLELKDVFDEYTDGDFGFTKTVVAVALSADPGDPHVSRSQAKRLMAGLNKFKHIVLDFKGVGSAGQAFVDEVFRVFQNEYPNIKIQYLNANEEVSAMIKRGAPNANEILP